MSWKTKTLKIVETIAYVKYASKKKPSFERLDKYIQNGSTDI